MVLGLHIVTSAVALTAGALQFSARVRATAIESHRWVGRLYVTGVLLGGISGLVLATRAQGGLPAQVGFAILAVLWLGTTLMGLARILSGRVADHRPWMIRSYALVLAAVTLRIYLPLSVVAGIPFESAYPSVAWLCWVPNLIVAEWLIISPGRSRWPCELTPAAIARSRRAR
jgi:hypothetical protein